MFPLCSCEKMKENINILCFREDKPALSKLTEAIKTNFNDRGDEVRFSHRIVKFLSPSQSYIHIYVSGMV